MLDLGRSNFAAVRFGSSMMEQVRKIGRGCSGCRRVDIGAFNKQAEAAFKEVGRLEGWQFCKRRRKFN